MGNEYKTLEQQIMELWKSRGLEVIHIKFQVIEKKSNEKICEWIIRAKVGK
jgi:hypothetical protein